MTEVGKIFLVWIVGMVKRRNGERKGKIAEV